MRIALLARFVWPSLGGTEVLVRTVAAALAERNDVQVFGHRIDNDRLQWRGPFDRSEPFGPIVDPDSGVVTRQLRVTPVDMALLAPYVIGPKRVGSRIRPLHYISLGVEAWYARINGRRFAATLDGVDIIHRFAGGRMTLATIRAARRLRRPIVVTPLAHAGHWNDDEISAAAFRQADLVVATSPADAEIYERMGVRADRLRVCSLPTRAPARGGGELLRRSGTVTGPLILFLGVRRPHKGVDSLLGAASVLLREAPSAQVAFVGPGPALPATAPPNVLDVGLVDDDLRDAWLDAADIVCLPSMHESWGLAVSEAWSVGAAVVTSDIPTLRERVESVGGGLAVPPNPRDLAEALLRLLRDDRMRRTMGRAGHEHYLRELSQAAYAAWHEEAYRRLLGR